MKSIVIAAVALLILLAACTTEKTVYVLPDGTEVTPTAAQAAQATQEAGGGSQAAAPDGSDNELSLEEIVETTSPSVVQIQAGVSSGSGFIISEDGLIVTNAHVVGNEREVNVWLSTGRSFNAEVMGLDSDADLAVVKIDGDEQFDALSLGNTEDIRLGAEVIALGFPLAEIGDDLTVTRGILSSTRTLDGVDFLQTDAAINQGNSGGPLINSQGEVIGVSTFKVSGFDVDNIGFAVSIVELEHRLDDMKERRAFMSISSGRDYSCALRDDGFAVCWGRNDDGQTMPPENERFKSISSGSAHACGLKDDGSVVCWGNNWQDIATPPEDERLTAISSGGGHTCGLRADSSTVCWGIDDSGQADFGQTIPPEDERFTAVSSGTFYTCGLRADGTIVCWGRNNFGQVMPPEDERFTAISSGSKHVCGLINDGSVVCWGRNDFGLTMPPENEQFTTVASGSLHTCGLRADGTVVCWGYKEYDQVIKPPNERFTAISAGDTHTCGLREDGVIVCWGDNEYGQASPPLR